MAMTCSIARAELRARHARLTQSSHPTLRGALLGVTQSSHPRVRGKKAIEPAEQLSCDPI
eukprot:5794152-Pyramimonas_sp.AAC.1